MHLCSAIQAAQERGNPLLASLNAKAASYINFKHFIAECKEVHEILSCQATPFNFARVGLVAEMVPCGPWARGTAQQQLHMRMLPLCELEQAIALHAGGGV
jgi:hypothetical protein